MDWSHGGAGPFARSEPRIALHVTYWVPLQVCRKPRLSPLALSWAPAPSWSRLACVVHTDLFSSRIFFGPCYCAQSSLCIVSSLCVLRWVYLSLQQWPNSKIMTMGNISSSFPTTSRIILNAIRCFSMCQTRELFRATKCQFIRENFPLVFLLPMKELVLCV